LVGVPLTGEHERFADLVSVDGSDRVVCVLGDDCEQVGEQLALTGVELLVALRQRGDRSIARLAGYEADTDVCVGEPGSGFLASRPAAPAPRARGLSRGLFAAALALDAVVLGVRRQAALALLAGCWSSFRNI
jgi:hypothetical protein